MKLPKELIEKKLKAQLEYNAKKGDLEAIKQNVLEGADLHFNKDLIFRISAKHGHIELLKYLIEQDANINAKNNDAIKEATANGHLDIVIYLIKKGVDFDLVKEALLVEAVKDKNNSHIVKYIIENGFEFNDQHTYILGSAIIKGNIEIARLLIDRGLDVKKIEEVSTFFHTNIIYKQIEMMKLLVENGADITINNNEILKFSCSKDELEITQYLFEQYEDKSIPIKIIKEYKTKNQKVGEWLEKYLETKELAEQFDTILNNKSEIKTTVIKKSKI